MTMKMGRMALSQRFGKESICRSRHDYFHRIFCNMVGNWVENGEYPNIDAALKRIVEGVSYANAARYFGL